MKDHKENFESKPSVRLKNTAKNQTGYFSKVILDKIDVAIKNKLRLNQCKSTKEVIDWFASIGEKPLYKFVQFDIQEFYSSIKEPLLEKALKSAEEYIDIPTDDKAIIKHTRKSLLFNKSITWMKKDSGLFDVATGAFYGAESMRTCRQFLTAKII